MTRDETNRKISELRGHHDFFYAAPDTCKCGDRRLAETHDTLKDWHADANWPALLRELPDVHLWLEDGYWWCSIPNSFPPPRQHLGEAVCLTWLKWKEQS